MVQTPPIGEETPLHIFNVRQWMRQEDLEAKLLRL
jgi:hypothetical protein